MEPLRTLSLFAGIGGFDLGLEATGGFKTVASCEISPKCQHLLRHHWPEVPVYDDICTLSAERLGSDGIVVDAICGGFPCQDLSFAGKGAGLAGERSGLWREYARLIRELRPRVVVVENVSALLSRGLGDVLGDLAALGYDAEWDCIRASDVGAWHRRNRLWIVAYARGVEHQGFGDAFRRALTEELLSADLLADASGERQPEARGFRCVQSQERPAGCGEALADANGAGLEWWIRSAGCQAPIAPAQRRSSHPREWLFEPDVGRVAHGVPARVDRLHGLGNAVVPQIPEILGRAILSAMEAA